MSSWSLAWGQCLTTLLWDQPFQSRLRRKRMRPLHSKGHSSWANTSVFTRKQSGRSTTTAYVTTLQFPRHFQHPVQLVLQPLCRGPIIMIMLRSARPEAEPQVAGPGLEPRLDTGRCFLLRLQVLACLLSWTNSCHLCSGHG